tara:strand:+ start:650 stop:934 length:285 start_codon:yes stop_codon:yes gene_type:complete
MDIKKILDIFKEHGFNENNCSFFRQEDITDIAKEVIAAINYTHCCTELKGKEDDTEYWVDLVNWESGGIEEVSNTNLIQFKKNIDIEIQRRLKK